MNRAFFCDRDGIINQRIIGDYVKSVEQFVFIDDFFMIFSHFTKLGYLPILITNQQGIGKGLMSENDLNSIHRFMNSYLLKNTGHQFIDIFFAPELNDISSKRRKPNPTMILEAAEKHNIDTKHSFMLGDSKSDILAGKNAGCKTILISSENYYESDFFFTSHREMINNIDVLF